MAAFRTVVITTDGRITERRYLDGQLAGVNYNTLKQHGDTLFVALFKYRSLDSTGWADSHTWDCVFKYTRPNASTGVL